MRNRMKRVIATGLVGIVAATLLGVVIASPASATSVTTEQEFRDSFANDTTVDLQNNITLTCQDGDSAATRTSGGDVTINGNNHTIHQTCDDEVLNDSAESNLTLNDVTITGGQFGGVIVFGSVQVNHSTLTGNSGGGTIESDGSVSLDHSSITNGEYAIQASGSINLDFSTIAFNSVPQNVGVEATVSTPSSISLFNSTVSNNSAFQGAIYGVAFVSLNYSTVVDNTVTGNGCDAQFGAARFTVIQCNEGANVNTGNNGSLFTRTSVIAIPHLGPNCSIDNTTSSGGYNWSDDDSCGFNQPSDVDTGTNPMLNSLANNGGSTQTRLPQTGSPLIDVIPPQSCTQPAARFGFAPQIQQLTDQRDVSRPQNNACDIGAVEVTPNAPPPNGQPGTVTVVALPAIAIEGGADGGFLYERSGDAHNAITLSIQPGGTATSGTDYTPLGGVTLAANQTSLFKPVHALQDNIPDDNETVIQQIVAGPGYTVGNPAGATVTIKEHGFCDNAPQAPYNDRASFDVHAAAIDCITAYHMAEGFDDGSYGATLPESRAQIASMVARLMNDAGVTMPASPPDAFPGDDGDVHELAINQLAALGVLDATTGQTGDAYNVSDPMRRDDMAQILVNAWMVITGEPLPSGPDAFTDDNSSDNQDAINTLAQLGVVEGTGGGLYDPSGSVSRGQMASFFVRYMQLLVGAGKLAPLP